MGHFGKRMRRGALCASFALAAAPSAFAGAPRDVDQVYAALAAGTRDGSRSAAAEIFRPDAVVTTLAGSPAPTVATGPEAAAAALVGREGIAEARFRVSARQAGRDRVIDSGVLRTRAGGEDRYARFSLVFERAPDGGWRISSAATAPADLHAFEDAPGELLPSGPERLSDAYYGNLVGSYRTSDGCLQEVTRSTGRLLLLDGCSGEFRALHRVSGRSFEAGRTVAAIAPFETTISFPGSSRQPASTMVLVLEGGPQRVALREADYSTQSVAFASRDGTRLAGTILVPARPGPHPGVVLVHGSGAQDRHGEASIIDVLARRFVHAGFAVLQYDKRGAGESSGDWRTASFATLAEDAAAGRALLMARSDVLAAHVGIAGSSQAGWIAARAVERDPAVAFVLLLGAGGSALSVQEQNAYNVDVSMACLGLSPPVRREVLRQHALYYRAERDPALRPRLAALTARLTRLPGVEPFAMPGTVDRSDPTQWFVAMETGFDPRPIWRRYRGAALFAFGDMDDQTPAGVAVRRLRQLGNDRIHIVRSPAAQHHGFLARDVCHVGFDQVSRFDARIWDAIGDWITQLGVRVRVRGARAG
jgi:dienelactone hydrolase/ketosteroid isomerase-like protein